MPTPVTFYKRNFDGRESRRFEGELVDDADGWLVAFSDASIHASFRRGGSLTTVWRWRTRRMLLSWPELE